MKTIVKRVLRRAGYEVRAIRPAASEPFPMDPEESEELDRELRAFSRSHPDCGPWSSLESAREYLSAKRVRFFHDLLSTCERSGVLPIEGEIADVGSGTGYLLRLIARRHPSARLTGYDTYEHLVRLSRHLCPRARIVEQDLFGIGDSGFAIVFCTEVLEHLVDPDEAMGLLSGMVCEGGHLILTVPDGRRDSLGAMQPYPNGKGYWGHINFWSPESWRLFIARHAGPDGEFQTGQLETGENYAIMRR